MLPLRKYRPTNPGLTDLLNWAALVDEGVVQTKCGSFLTGFYYRGPDSGYATDSQRNQTTGVINAALVTLGSGWCIWSDIVRLPASSYPAPERNYFPDEVTALIDQERRETYEAEGNHYISEHVLILMYSPPTRTERQIRRVAGKKENTALWPHETLKAFHRAVRELADRLGTVIDIRRMGAYGSDYGLRDELVDYLGYILTGESLGINLPSAGMYLDAVIGGAADLTTGYYPALTIDGQPKFLGIVSISGFPTETWPNILASLETLPVDYRWSTRMIFMDQQGALTEIARYRRQWKQRSRGFFDQLFQTSNGPVNEDALRMAGETESAMADAQSDLVRYGYYTSVIVLRHTDLDELLTKADEVRTSIQRLGFLARVETVNAVDAWLGSLPGHPHPNIRRPLLHSLNLADLLPLSSVWSGHATCPNPMFAEASPPLLHGTAVGTTPFRLHLHAGDVGHTLIFGPTGAGKSTLLALLCAQFLRYKNASIFALDRGRSLETLVRACNGSHYRLAGDEETGLAPLDLLDDHEDRDWAAQWIAELFVLQAEKNPTTRQRSAITKALHLLSDAPPGNRSLTEFCATVQDMEVREAVDQYTLGQSSGILDATNDTISLSHFVVIEVEELLSTGEKNYLPVLYYLFRRFERSLNGQPALLVLGEAWALLSHPTFQEKIREWLKTLRKKNCAVIVETQSLSDAVRSGIYDVLLESCPTRILLPNAEADKPGTDKAPGPRDYYQMMGLNEADIAILKSAIPKRQYYYVSPEGRRLFELELGPVAAAFVAVSDQESLAERQRLEDAHGGEWPEKWLQQRKGEHRDL